MNKNCIRKKTNREISKTEKSFLFEEKRKKEPIVRNTA
jgi:hypothetical protein